MAAAGDADNESKRPVVFVLYQSGQMATGSGETTVLKRQSGGGGAAACARIKEETR
jgi:hypothetical protein